MLNIHNTSRHTNKSKKQKVHKATYKQVIQNTKINKATYKISKQQILIIHKINNPKIISGQQQIDMKGKKKPTTPKHTPLVKMLNVRTLEPQKHMLTSGQKTYLTIEENIKTFENADTEGSKEGLRGRFSFTRKSYNERMEAHNLSPFSNDERSASPKWRKTPEKIMATNKQERQVKFTINLKQLEKKKPAKGIVNSARDSYTKKSTTPSNARTLVGLNSVRQQPISTKKKPVTKKKKSNKSEKQQKARIQFQNEFLSMMNNRIHKQKITEMSDEEQEGSIKKRKPVLQIQIHSETNSDKNNHSREDHKIKNLKELVDRKIKEKKELVKTMQIKVMKNIQRDYPNLDVTQKKVICAVIIVQRLWRQQKVKQFFEHYVTPKASPESSFRDSLKKQNSESTMNLLAEHVRKKEESNSWQVTHVPKKKQVGVISIKGEDNFLIRQKSQESCKQLYSLEEKVMSYHQQSTKKQSILNQKDQQQSTKIQYKLNQKDQQQSTKKQYKLNQKVTDLFQASILPFQNQNQKIIKQSPSIDPPSMLKFIQCYRQIKLCSNKKQSKSKRNIFSLKQSLSQKCLMQKYYTRIFSDRPQKDKPKNYELFSLNSSSIGNQMLKQNQQSSIELFRKIDRNNEYLSPQKLQKRDDEEDLWVRNETSYGQEGNSQEYTVGQGNTASLVKIADKNCLNKKIGFDEILYAEGFFGKQITEIKTEKFVQEVIVSPKRHLIQEQATQQEASCGIVINKQQLKQTQQHQQQQQKQQYKQQPQQPKPQYSLKSIQTTSQSILTNLLSQFFTQYLAFQQKQCLVKKHRSKEPQKQKKPKLPGIQISASSITQYLDILMPYILNDDRQQVLKSLQLFHPFTYQKCHRVQSIVYEVFDFGQEEEDDIYWNIITNEGFFACLQDYWKKNVVLTKEQEKFTNFLDLTYKVYNRCITDAFSQLFNKHVLEKVIYPWNCLTSTLKAKLCFSPQTKSLLNPHLLQAITSQVKEKLLKQSFCYSTTAGKLIKKDRKSRNWDVKKEFEFGEVQKHEQMVVDKLSDEQFTKVMKIADDQFLQDEKDLMHCVDERYELCGDLCEAVLGELMKEMMRELGMFESSFSGDQLQMTKSQQQVFLETNQTLETNYHF